MARYLTPAKICTLILVESYLQNREDPESDVKLLEIITEQLIENTGNTSCSRESHSKTSVENIAGPPQDASNLAAPLSSIPSNFPGRTHYDDFVQTAWTVADLDQLHRLFDRAFAILTPENPEERKVTPASPIGHFIRRCNVEWTRLRFADSLALLNAYKSYIATTWSSWARTQPEAAKSYVSRDTGQDSVPLPVPAASSATAPMISNDDIDIALSISIHTLQKRGARVPPELKAKLRSWLSLRQTSDTQNLHHFMDFFEAWRAGQYTMALEELHRYFDYSIAAKGAAADGVKTYYQIALLHLSVLHADFERWEESLGTMEECIATGKRRPLSFDINLMPSLGFGILTVEQLGKIKTRLASTLLFHGFSISAKPTTYPSVSSLRSLAALAGDGGSEQDELAFLKTKAKDGKHWNLVSSTLLEEAKLELRNTGVSPKALEHVLQSAHLNVQHASYSLMPAVTIFQGSIYDRLGQSHTASRHYSSIDAVLEKECSLGDRVRSQCRLAFSMAQNGAYAAAQDSLSELHEQVKGTLKLEQRVSAFARLIALLQAIRSDNLPAAHHHLAHLLPLQPTSDPELTQQVSLLEITLLTRSHQLPSALSKISSLLSGASTDLAQTLHLLTLKASVFAAAGKPEKGFSLVVRAASRAERAGLVPVLLEALAELAGILNKLGEFGASRDVIEAALPQALESGPADLPARFFLLLTSSFAGLANPAVTANESERQKHLRQGLRWAERAREISGHLADHSAQLTALLMKSALSEEMDDELGVREAEAKYEQLVAGHEAMLQAR
ncbi:hypothetical protein Q7P37_006403 [Cladosporium fusiforme]